MLHQIKTLSYLFKSRPYRLEKPVVLQFPVIDICNSQCQMCRIWENKKSDDVTPEQLRHGLRNPLFSEVTGVGLNGGEPTLRKDLGTLAEVLFDELPRLKVISLITNSYRYEEVIERIAEVGEVAKRHGGALDVMVSLDGLGDVHDRVRGKPGNFDRAEKVISFIKSSPLVSSVRIGCTIIRENVYGLSDLFEYCRENGLYIKYRLGIPHQRLYTSELKEPYALTDDERYHVAEFLEGLIAHYETNEYQKYFYRSLIDQIVHHAPRKAGCDWQHRGATITSKGELLYCAVQSKVLGKINETDSNAAYFGNEAHLKEILKTKCADCNHDYVGIPPRPQYFRQLSVAWLRRIHAEPLVRRIVSTPLLSFYRHRRLFEHRRQKFTSLIPAITPTRASVTEFRVLVCGWYGTETLGDKGILAGVVASVRQALGDVHFVLVSLNPYISEATRRQMPELRECEIVTPEQGVKLAAEVDLLVFGGGPLMAINELAEMEAMFASAYKHGVPTAIAGCGVGPLGAEWHAASLKRILSLSSLRIYRDEKSRQLAAKLGIDVTNDLSAEDPAFTWLHDRLDSAMAYGPPAGQKVLLLGLRDFPHDAYARGMSLAARLEAKANYERVVVKALETLCDRYPDLVVRPLPMCTNHFGDDDRWYYRRLFRSNQKLKSRLDQSLLGAELSPDAYVQAFRSAHVALTMRFHSLVFALGLHVPAVVIDYTLGRGKVSALAERFNVPCQNLSTMNVDTLVEQLSEQLQRPVVQAEDFIPKFAEMMAIRLPLLLGSAREKQTAAELL